ncbi:MAG TPA: hypothetical protein VHN15_07765 [Thermoanaerobaculia bacterium]|nr:hypothetical protein [Thermoanaerobaculia bacterium]
MTPGGPPGRRILANLHCEDEWAGGRRTLGKAALSTAAAAGTLLRAFAREGDRLWLPAPVDPGRMAAVPGLPVPEIETGPLAALPPAGAVLTWGATSTVILSEAKDLGGGALSREAGEGWGGGPLHDLLWHLPPPPPEVASAVHHRGFCLRVAESLGFALPGARMVASLADLETLLAAPGAPRSWVVKAPLSAAGRDRYVGREGVCLDDPAARRAVAGLFRRFGRLLFEPWMERTDDFGCAALLLPDGELRVVSFHRQLVDRRGQFLGIELAASFAGLEGLSEEERGRMETALSGVAEALREAGYHGPFGIDAWQYRSANGSLVLHPLGEINARMTFGLVARALVDRLREPLELAGTVRLRFGREVPRGAGVVALLHPGGEPPMAAWIEPAGAA